jgi:methylated-DNA-[protein]-cysteine S-methyltransferase
MRYWTRLNSPIGPLTITVDNAGALVGIDLRGTPGPGPEQPARCRNPVEQLKAYFAGQRRQFDLPVDAGGSDFQQTGALWARCPLAPR